MNKKTLLGIVYLLIILIAASSVLAAGSKPIAGFVFHSDTTTPARNATVVVYVNNSLVLGYNPCKTVPSVYSGIDGSFATNLANLKNSSGDGDCSGLWATGNAIWSEADGSTVINLGPQGNGSSSGDTVSPGSGLQYLSNITLGPNLLPNITLIAPPNNTITNPVNMAFNYSVSDDFGIENCSLIINGTINQTNSSVVEDIPQTFTVNLGVGTYDWSVNCTDNSIEESSSEIRTLTISALVVGQLQASLITPTTNTNVDQNQFFSFTAQVICVGGDCGNVTAYLDPISPIQEKEKKSFFSILINFFLNAGNFITGLAAGNLVPTTPTTPFWTNSSNPADLNNFSCLGDMVAGSSCNVTWSVNATGNLSTVAEFFAYFNATTYALYNETQHINITISEFIPPTIFNFTPPANSTYTGFQIIEIAVNASDNTNISTVLANITYPNGVSEIIPLIQVGNTSIFNTSYTIPNIGGVYNITFLINDTFNNLNDTVSTYFNVIAIAGISELTQTANIINYFDTPLNHTVTVTNTGNESVNTSTPLPAGWTFVGGDNCTLNGTNIICSLPVNATAQYIILDPGSASAEYAVSVFPINALNNNYTGNTVQFLNIQNKELFHTLVEYGRGRGNYFFDSAFAGAGSGHTGASCPYVPDETLFELNFLHKILNVNQYYGNLSAEAYNATFSCTYPNSSVVREHLISNIVTNTSGAYTDYFISTITGSWERMGFLSMDFREDEQFIGEYLSINCTNISYYFPIAGGYMYIGEDSFDLEVRDREPFVASASTADTIGNGTQEVLINYNITNTEIYTADEVIIEIQAPPYAEFIGVRGELWGSALDQYRIEKGQLLPGESEIIQLVARFDTSTAPNITSINLTSNIKIEYTTCWELNAYNPTEYTHQLTPTGAAAVDMGTTTSITSIVNLIIQIDSILTTINSTIIDINQTVTNIQTIVDIINTTTQDTNILVKALNSTASDVLNKTNILLNNTNIILNDTQFLSDQLNCNGTNDSPLCDKVLSINQSIYDLYNLSLYLNYTAHNLNITVIENINTSGVNITVNVDFSNLTQELYRIKNAVNCTNQTSNSVCGRVARIENYTKIINNTLNELQNIASYFNTTVFGNLTFQDILDAMSNSTADTSGVLEALQKLREFDEEIVFLITDSFGSQLKATNEFAQGDLVPSLNSLTAANNNLKKAASKLLIERDILMTLEPAKAFNVVWVLIGMIIMISVAGFVFLFRRVPPGIKKPPQQQQQPPKPNYSFNQRFPTTENKSQMTRY